MSEALDYVPRDKEFVMHEVSSLKTRVAVFADPLLRMGVTQFLDETRFVVVDSSPHSLRRPGVDEENVTSLFIVDENYRPREVHQLIAEIKDANPAARVVVLADQFTLDSIVSARHAGADGFCLKTSSRDVLIGVVELVMLGEVVIPSNLILTVLDGKAHQPSPGPVALLQTSGAGALRKPLSTREIEVLNWLKEGATNKVIARKLDLTEATIKVHVKAILRKVGLRNRAQAAIWAAYNLPAESTEGTYLQAAE